MGAVKQAAIEENHQEILEQENICECCGESLNSEAKAAGRQECFDCYSANQD